VTTPDSKLYGSIIIFADDSEEYFKKFSEALTGCFDSSGKQTTTLKWVRDGEELLHYLMTTDHYKSPQTMRRRPRLLFDLYASDPPTQSRRSLRLRSGAIP
jgi:hypothetical protein